MSQCAVVRSTSSETRRTILGRAECSAGLRSTRRDGLRSPDVSKRLRRFSLAARELTIPTPESQSQSYDAATQAAKQIALMAFSFRLLRPRAPAAVLPPLRTLAEQLG